MVKGVNKTVIVVNDTGSKYFERIVFYVTPEYGTLSPKELNKATRDFTFTFGDKPASSSGVSLRKRCNKKRKLKLISLLAGALLAGGCLCLTVALILIL
jgi:hypothetical protein